MCLQGQGSQRGYAMAAVLVSIAVLTILMSAAMPVWRHQAQREKEAELVFRGNQYAQAIRLYQRKAGPGTYPPSIDILVQQRFLRKKFKDPMVADGEFQVISPGSVPGQGQQPGGRAGGQNPGTGRGQAPQAQQPAGTPGGGSTSPFAGTGAVMGVVSKSRESSIMIYRGMTHYNEWQFLGVQTGGRPGGPGQGRPGGPGGVGAPGGGRGPGRANAPTKPK
jgi:type II secretory pathway pseudopilin PulG